jgi:hypothetical protein
MRERSNAVRCEGHAQQMGEIGSGKIRWPAGGQRRQALRDWRIGLGRRMRLREAPQHRKAQNSRRQSIVQGVSAQAALHDVRGRLSLAVWGLDQQLHHARAAAQQLHALRLDQRARACEADCQQEDPSHCAAQQRGAQPSQSNVGHVLRHVSLSLRKEKATQAMLAWLIFAERPNQYIFGGSCMLRTRL